MMQGPIDWRCWSARWDRVPSLNNNLPVIDGRPDGLISPQYGSKRTLLDKPAVAPGTSVLPAQEAC
jgi:hypothetical protein